MLEALRGRRSWGAVVKDHLVFLLAVFPFITDYLQTGKWFAGVFAMVLNAVLGGIIFTIVLLLRQARRRQIIVEGLRQTLIEAIIHDLKNPMTSIMGCLSCLIHESADAEQQHKLLRLAQHSCYSQMELLETLVDTSRLEEGELTAHRALVDAKGLLEDILDDARGTAAYLGVTLRDTIAPDIPAELQVDAELLRRILANLIHNALKYTPSGGSVGVDVRMHGESLQFEISDTGIGIAAKHLGRLFEKYYRVEGGDQAARRGSGLGLYFCRLAVEAHGGTIRVSSEIDKGTKIVFDIPIKGERGS